MKMPGWIRRRRLGFESGSEMLPELHDFRPDDCGAVTLERILREVFLVIGLRFIPGGCRYKLRDNRILIDLFFRERRDDFLCDPLLLGTMIKDGRSILSADIVSLAVKCRGIVDHEEYFYQLPICYDLRIKCDANRFCM